MRGGSLLGENAGSVLSGNQQEKHTKTIGYIYPKHDRPLTAPEEAREIGGHVKALLKTDPDLIDGYLDLRHSGHSHDAALEKLRDKSNEGWLFEKCIEQMITDRTAEGSDDPLKPASEKDIRSTFKKPAFEEILKSPIGQLTRADIEEARNMIRRDHGISPANKAIAWTRSVFSWMLKHHAASGVDGRDTWWEQLHSLYKVTPKTRKPEVEDIVRSLILAEEYLDKALPGRMFNRASVGAGVLAGLWWIVLTAQRGDAALSLKTYNLIDDVQRGEGWKVAAWDPGQMKGGQAMLLPIPPRAAEHIDRIRLKAKNHGSRQWAFPSDRDPDIHATVSGVYRILYRLAGRDALIQKKPKDWEPKRKFRDRTERRDLLAEAGIEWWSAHDVRRTIRQTLDEAGIPGGASVILAHEMKSDIDLTVSMPQQQREDFMRNRVARITSMAYGAAQFGKLKAEAMQIWTDKLLDEYQRQKALSLPEHSVAA